MQPGGGATPEANPGRRDETKVLMMEIKYATGGRPASSNPEQLDGHKLAQLLRGADSASRMHLAIAIVAGRFDLLELTPRQICDICRVPESHRARVLEAGERR